MKTLIVCLIIFWALTANGQASSPNTSSYEHQSMSGYYLDIYSEGKRVGPSNYNEAIGSPMLNNEWDSGWVLLVTGQQFSNIPLQFSIAENQLYFKKDSTAYVFTAGVNAFRFKYNDKGIVKEAFFRNIDADGQGGKPGFFYQVIAEGTAFQFLKLLKADVSEEYAYAEPSKSRYIIRNELYLYDVTNNKLIKINTNTKSILNAVPAYKDQVLAFATANNSKFKSEKEITALVKDLNKN